MRIPFFILILTWAFSCSISSIKDATSDEVALAHIKSNLEFLASDDLEGRLTTARGSRVAGQFIANHFKKYGIKPFGDDSSYFQHFDLQRSTYLSESRIVFPAEDLVLEMGTNFIPFRTADPVLESDLIYVGYGISDSALNWDDYKDVDVTGKVVLSMYGIPVKKDDPDFFKEGKKWQSSFRKASFALEQGAKGAIIINSEYVVENWDEYASSITAGSISRIDTSKTKINAAWIDTTTAKRLLGLNDLNYKNFKDTLNSGFIKSGTILNTKVSIDIQRKIEIVVARNVIGILGDKPTAKTKAVLYGTHYDHEGIKGGKIFNGADDNASGTTAMLEVVRQFSFEKEVERPIIFCFWDAEEKGLIGSEHFVNTYKDISEIGFHINADMVGRGAADSIYIIGTKGVSDDVGKIVESVNSYPTLMNLNFSYDDVDHKDRPYQRSDHWPFAKMNIPFIGLGDKDRVDYHKHTDTADKIIFSKVLRTVKFIKAVGLEVANLDHDLTIDRVIDFGDR